MNGNGLHDLRMVRRRLAELDRDIYAKEEIVRWTRNGTSGGKSEDREQTIANYRAEIDDHEAEADELRYLIALHDRTQQEERQRTRAAWPTHWQAALFVFVAFVLFLVTAALVRIW